MEVNVDIINIPGNTADWKWALQVPTRDLPRLTQEQKATAKDFGISEEEYARSVIARQYSEARYRRYAEHFGDLLEKAAKSHDIESVKVIYDGWEDKFHCRLKINKTELPLDFDANIITEPLDRGDKSALLQAQRDLKRAVEWISQELSKKRKVSSR